MNIPTNINVYEIIKTPNDAAIWLATETVRFINGEDSKLELDKDAYKYIEALSYAFASAIGMYIDDDGQINDQRGMIDMFITGIQSLMSMSYLIGYQHAQGEINAT